MGNDAGGYGIQPQEVEYDPLERLLRLARLQIADMLADKGAVPNCQSNCAFLMGAEGKYNKVRPGYLDWRWCIAAGPAQELGRT